MIVVFATGLLIAQFLLPLRLAFLPLLIALFHLGNPPIISEFTPMRLVILAGLIRAGAGGFIQWSIKNRLDQLVGLFSIVALISFLGHEASVYVPSPFIERSGLVLNVLGSYTYARTYFSGTEVVSTFSTCLAVVLIPFSAMMVLEQTTGHNFYASLGLGAKSEMAASRNERFRARGIFGHPILSGTAAAVAFPFMLLVRRRRTVLGTAGMIASVTGTVASASSGPAAALGVIIGLLIFWRWRHLLGRAKVALVLVLVVLAFIMKRPIWFLIARMDIVGGSTGWHRSMLIDAAIKDLDAWWLAGTDYTRHWMFSGVTWNPNHTDITNYYLQMGVLGGLPLMFTFIAILFTALRRLERSMPAFRRAGDGREFEAWCVWTAIIAHAVSFLSIAYFDQSYAGFFLLIGAVTAIVEREPVVKEEAFRKPQQAASVRMETPVHSQS